MPRPYATILSTPGLIPRLLAVLMSAMPLGMLSLAIVLSVREWTGSFGAAGVISGLFSGGNALGLALQGAAIDRFGARRTIVTSGLLCTAMLFCLLLSGQLGAPLALTALAAASSGVTIPAVTAAVRAWLGRALSGPVLQSGAYALLAALFQAGVTIGPAAVSLALIVHEPSLAISAAGLLVLAATVLLARADDGVPPPRRRRPWRRGAQGALRGRGFLTLMVLTFLHGAALGVTVLAISALATETSRPVLAGIALTVLAIGEMSGALVYGAVAWPGSRRSRLPAVQAMAVLAALGVFLSTGQPALLLAAMFVAGALAAPVAVLTSSLLDVVVHEGAVGRAYTVIVASGLVATALGNAGAGQLVGAVGARGLLLVPALSIAAAATWTLARRGTLRRSSPPVSEAAAATDDTGGRA